MPWHCTSCLGDNPEGTRFCGHCGTAAAKAEARPLGGEEESRLVTALFADVSGFTSLADRLDADDLHDILSPLIARLARLAERYDGFVAKYAGDALLVFFGAPVACEDHAQRALRVAMAMHRDLADAVADDPERTGHLRLHIGVNTGRVVAALFGSTESPDYSILGDAVNVAQRLEASAPPGHTYVGDTTWRLASASFNGELVGDLELKGKSTAVRAWRLAGERATPTAGRPAGAALPFVGRTRERAAFGEAVAALRSGCGGVVAVSGDAGAGKSRLVDEACRAAEAVGVRWLSANCVSYGDGLAYFPYADLVRRFAGVHLDDTPDVARRRVADALGRDGVPNVTPFLARITGLPAPETATLEPEAFRRDLHAAFRAWFSTLVADGPLVVAIEDCHWLDPSSQALTVEVLRLARKAPLLVCLTARPDGAPVIERLLAAGIEARRIELGAFDGDDVAALVRASLGGDVPDEVTELVAERTDGNPFFVEEVVRSLQESGALIADAAGAWRLEPGWDAEAVPPTVEGVVATRIDRLPRDAVTVLQRAAVIGRRVRMPLLEAVCEGMADYEAAVERAVESGLLERTVQDGHEVVMFHHALVVDVAYARLLRRHRRELHLRVAEAGEALYGAGDDTIDLLARHLYLAGAGRRAVPYLVRAGQRAERLFAHAEAIRHYERALELARADEGEGGSSCAADTHRSTVPALLLQLGALHEVQGGYAAALDCYEEARQATNDVRAWRGLVSTLRCRGEYAEALRVVDRAYDAVGLADDTLTLWLERGWTLGVAGRYAECVDALHAGLAVARDRRDAVVGQILLQLAQAEIVEGLLDAAIEHGQRGRGVLEEAGDVRGVASALRVLGHAYTQTGRSEDALDAIREALILARRTGSAEELGGCLINLGMAEFGRGNLDVAIACDREAIEEFERIGHGSGRAIGYGNLAEKLAHAGHSDEAMVWCRRALEHARAIGHPLTVADATRTLAWIHFNEGDYADAGRRAEEAAGLFLAMAAQPAAADSLALAARAWVCAGDQDQARQAEDRAASIVGRT